MKIVKNNHVSAGNLTSMTVIADYMTEIDLSDKNNLLVLYLKEINNQNMNLYYWYEIL